MSQIQPAEMAEKGAGPVVIKSSKRPKSEVKYENDREYENVEKKKEPAQSKPDNDEYAEIAAQNGVYQTLDTTGIKSDKPAERNHSYQRLACCFGTLCIILVLIIIGVCVYFRESTASELNQLKSNQKVLLQENLILTDLNNKLSSDNDNLTLVSMALKNNNTMLTAENHNLTLLNEKLMEDRKNLTELIKNMEETSNELNVSRAQWSIDQYCPKNKVRSCTSCQEGWNYQLSSCYAYHDAEAAYRTNWDGAREDCKKMNSDLTVVSDNTEKIYVKTLSPVIGDITGYWIGLRAIGGKWKWLDGSDLTNQTWIQQQNPTDGQCVTSLQTREWTSVSCTEKYNWICEKKALSV